MNICQFAVEEANNNYVNTNKANSTDCSTDDGASGVDDLATNATNEEKESIAIGEGACGLLNHEFDFCIGRVFFYEGLDPQPCNRVLKEVFWLITVNSLLYWKVGRVEGRVAM